MPSSKTMVQAKENHLKILLVSISVWIDDDVSVVIDRDIPSAKINEIVFDKRGPIGQEPDWAKPVRIMTGYETEVRSLFKDL
jgi:hypothetical protein